MEFSLCGVLLALCICPLACLAVSPCPTGCCCPGFLVLCESLGLRSLPRSVPLSTSALSVARNQLCNVDHQLWPFSGLQELRLSHNLLARFPRGLPPSLESLQLQENRITYITSGVLRQLGNLTHLDLEDNLPESAFDSLPRLRSVDLTNNLWVCECDILYLYRWLLSGRLKMATDIVCTEPDHLAHRLLLNLSVVTLQYIGFCCWLPAYLKFHNIAACRCTHQSSPHIFGVFVQGAHVSRVFIVVHNLRERSHLSENIYISLICWWGS
uniref:Si:ch211-191d15.2 n=1 Tax=Haplochromis burtoni TaxID=8153 RepID=A0A3Q2V911_HAPBU